MPRDSNYLKAVSDFYEARRKADLRDIYRRLTGISNRLFSYEEVRSRLKVIEGNQHFLKEIPIDSIIGSVGRYSDFDKDFLPRRDGTKTRWAAIMDKATSLVGLPPIDVYQIGDAYFVLDGNHRVSVARELGSTHLQAYVTKLKSRVPFDPDTSPDELIIKAEQVNFLEHTQIDILRPAAKLSVSNPGQYPIIEEHISVHRYFLGVEANREITMEEAVTHWYDEVYLPVIKIIQERAILKYFPKRTETDLYIWLSKHRADLEESLGWELGFEAVADDLVYKYARKFKESIVHFANRVLEIVIPDSLDSGSPVGHWRQKYVEEGAKEGLFNNILVGLGKDPKKWQALDQAIILAQRENAQLQGLHVVPSPDTLDDFEFKNLKAAFRDRCEGEKISGDLALEVGTINRVICKRSHWADLILVNLEHPPGEKAVDRLGSGYRTLVRRCPRPILGVPGEATQINRPMLAYSDSPKSEEALYIAAYLACKWGIQLSVLTIDQEGTDVEKIQKAAQSYLESNEINAIYIQIPSGPRADLIVNTAEKNDCDIILMGGYKASPIFEVVQGSVVDEVLRKTHIPVLTCR